MKALNLILLVSLLIFSSESMFGQKYKFQKLSSDIKKEAKKYENEGWNNFPGGLPISQQLNSSYIKQNETDENGVQKWFFATGIAVAQTLAVAEMQATELAKNNLVQQVESDIRSFTETTLANNQISKDEAESITKTINAVTNKMSQKLGRVIPLVKIYRESSNNFEVQLQVGYNIVSAQKIMLNEVKKELGEDSEKIKTKMEAFLYNSNK